ncbi:MAG: ion transporter [Saprospiraceae bacterium]|nr:ion transporter [Saprospiraceae bacterium]
MRAFRIFKLEAVSSTRATTSSFAIIESLKKTHDICFSIIIVACVFGSFIYLVEHKVNPVFDSIPRSIYWTMLTITQWDIGDTRSHYRPGSISGFNHYAHGLHHHRGPYRGSNFFPHSCGKKKKNQKHPSPVQIVPGGSPN